MKVLKRLTKETTLLWTQSEYHTGKCLYDAAIYKQTLLNLKLELFPAA